MTIHPTITARVAELKARDTEVREHEMAHFQAAGGLALSGPVITDYVVGPDGEMYADGGHVLINTAETGDPYQDLHRGAIITIAAEAPLGIGSDLSGADMEVADKGRAMVAKSRAMVAKLDQLKNRLGGKANQISQGRLATLAASLGLDLPAGRILSLIA